MLQNVAELVHMAAVNQRDRSKRLRHRFVQRLRAVENHQQAAIGTQAAALKIREEALADRRILRRPIPEAERVFGARGVDAQCDHDAVLADVEAVDQ